MYTQLFRIRAFALLWLTQFCATLGNELYDISMMVVIFTQTQSVLQSSGILIAKMVPTILLSPFAGVVVDRYPHKWVMVGMNLLRAGLVLLALPGIASGTINLWWIYTIVLGLAVADTFHKPAQQAIVPQLTPAALLMQANSALVLITLSAFGIAFLLAGSLAVHFGAKALILINLACFLAAAALASKIAMQPRLFVTAAPFCPLQLWRSFGEGLTYLRQHKLARTMLTIEVLEGLPDSMWSSAITLAFVQQALQATSAVWGLQNSLYYVGQIVGSVLALLFVHRLVQLPGRFIVIDTIVTTVLNMSYALSPNVPFALLVCFAFGPPVALREVVQNALLQSCVAPGVLGRVYSLRQMLLTFILVIGGVGFAWLADQMPVRWIILAGTVGYVGAMGYAWLHPAIRAARLPIYDPLEAADRGDIDSQNYQPIL